MSRISVLDATQVPDASRPLFEAVQRKLGVVPNLVKVLGHSPAALEGYLSLSGALDKGSLEARLRGRLALAVAEFNGCEYCLAAHSYLGQHALKLDGAEIDAARDARSSDAESAAALRFARRVAEERGHVSDADIQALGAAGFDAADAVEIVAHVALNVLTNYLNNVACTDVDFPRVLPKAA